MLGGQQGAIRLQGLEAGSGGLGPRPWSGVLVSPFEAGPAAPQDREVQT